MPDSCKAEAPVVMESQGSMSMPMTPLFTDQPLQLGAPW